MIICDPRNAPWMSWWLGYRLQGIKYWIALLFPLGRLRVPLVRMDPILSAARGGNHV